MEEEASALKDAPASHWQATGVLFFHPFLSRGKKEETIRIA